MWAQVNHVCSPELYDDEPPGSKCLFLPAYGLEPCVTYHFFFCVAAYRILPLLTDHSCSCVWMCQGQEKRPLGDAYLNTCHNLFFWGRIQTPVLSDRPFCFPCVFVTGNCVRNIGRGVQRIPIWIHIWSAAHSPFFLASYRLWPFQTENLSNRVCMCQE